MIRIFAMAALATVISSSTVCASNPLVALGRYLGYGWSDGYHSRNACPSCGGNCQGNCHHAWVAQHGQTRHGQTRHGQLQQPALTPHAVVYSAPAMVRPPAAPSRPLPAAAPRPVPSYAPPRMAPRNFDPTRDYEPIHDPTAWRPSLLQTGRLPAYPSR